MLSFENFGTHDLELDQDFLPTDKTNYLIDSGIYTCIIKNAYLDQSQSGAKNVTVTLVFPQADNKEYTESFYYTSKKNPNSNIYIDASGNKKLLPGYSMLETLSLFASGLHLSEQNTAPVEVMIYDYNAKSELPKTVEQIVSLIGKTINVAIIQAKTNKQAKNTATGQYENTSEAKYVNRIHKFLNSEFKTYTESKSTQTSSNYVSFKDKFLKLVNSWENGIKDEYKDTANSSYASLQDKLNLSGSDEEKKVILFN